MSRYVKDICREIRKDPGSWTPLSLNSIYCGLKNNSIIIKNAGLGYMTSVLELYIDGQEIRLMRWDRFRLEVVISNWYKKCDLSKMLTVENQDVDDSPPAPYDRRVPTVDFYASL